MPIAISPPPAQSGQFDAAQGFPPIANDQARVLILGSMPGIASLRAEQYYAHPRNQFWRIMASILDIDLVALAYPQRRQALLDAGIALWDVLQSCHRPGSLDADIAPESVVVNDFVTFFRQHPAIHHLYFNGAAAEHHFKRRVEPLLTFRQTASLAFQRLPSTSPTHAALDFPTKLTAWRAVAKILGQTGGLKQD
jgi:double-stranded uracil-DNA glycosylase